MQDHKKQINIEKIVLIMNIDIIAIIHQFLRTFQVLYAVFFGQQKWPDLNKCSYFSGPFADNVCVYM